MHLFWIVALLPVCSKQCLPLLLTATKQEPDVIQLSQVTKLSNTSGFIASVKLTFNQLKHHYNQSSISIVISRQADVCPVENLLRYFPVYGSVAGPYFNNRMGTCFPYRIRWVDGKGNKILWA